MNDWSFIRALHLSAVDISAVAAFLLLLLGPLPLALVGSEYIRPPQDVSIVSRANRSLRALLYWIAFQFLLTTTLAGIGKFTLPTALLGSAGLLLLGVALYLRSTNNLPSTQTWPHRVNRADCRDQQSIPMLWLAFGLITLLLLGNLLIQPVTDYDSLYYHLPFMANLHATGRLSPDSVVPVVAWYPYGWEVLCALFLLPTAGDIFVALPNLIAWGLWGGATYIIARRLGSVRLAAIAAVLLLLTQPLVLDQLNSLRVDLALAALFMAGLAMPTLVLPVDDAIKPTNTPTAQPTIPVHKDLTNRDDKLCQLFWPTLLVIFLLPAVKTSGIIYSGLLLIVWLFCTWITRQPVVPLPKRVPWLSMLLIVGMLGTSLFWYLQNWVVYGNPLGTVEVRLGTWLIFPGSTARTTIQQSTLAALFAFTDATHRQLYLTQIWQQGSFAWLGLTGFATAALVQLRNATQRRAILAALGGTLLLALLYWVTPYSGDDGSFGYHLNGPWVGQAMRFALPMLGMLAVLAALGANGILTGAQHGEWVVGGIALALALATVAQRSTLYLFASGFVLLCALGYVLVHKYVMSQIWQWFGAHLFARQQRNDWTIALTTFVSLSFVILLLLIAFPSIQEIRNQRRLQVYGPLPQLIDELSAPGESVAVFYSHQSYLANGQTLQRRVVQMPTNFADPVALHAWFENAEIALFVIGPLRPEWQRDPAVGWLTAPNAQYELIYDGFPDHPRLYRVLP